MSAATDTTVIGAGPYGLSIGAHLRALKADFRILGSPMHFWRNNMPKGMHLKSAGFASDLYDPDRLFTLESFCKAEGIPYADVDLPVSLDTFCAYAIAFQQAMVPMLENENVVQIDMHRDGFELRLQSGERFTSRRVVVAVGVDYFRRIPALLTALPASCFSHSAEHSDLGKFHGREVAVLGAGASAVDTAVLLREEGARASLITRRPALAFGVPWGGAARPYLQRLRAPLSPVGPGWKCRLCTEAPWLYRYLPDDVRLRVVRNTLGPEGGWFMKNRMNSIPVLAGQQLRDARFSGGRVQLQLTDREGQERNIETDHVIAATGFDPDVRRIPFLSREIVKALQLTGNTPRLSAGFESSLRGLYFAGPMAATSFGPVMRFAAGAGFASRRISQRLAQAS
jgi:thioredoxin reductase